MTAHTATGPSHPTLARDAWAAERLRLLAREKAHLRESDQLARERRALPWLHIDKRYVFDTPEGPRALADLFDGHSQLLVQHFMFAPGWEAGCPSCSFMADHIDGARPHLAQRDVAFVAISRAPLADIDRFRRRMGWQFRWVSSHGSDFNFDMHVAFTPEALAAGDVYYNFGMQPFPVEEAPGVSVFTRDAAGEVYLTYATFGRGVEVMMGTYRLLDLAPKGRDEDGLEHTMSWVRHHDRYATAPAAAACCAAHG